MSGIAGHGTQNRTLQVKGLYCQDKIVLDEDGNLNGHTARFNDLTVRNGQVVCGQIHVKGNVVIEGTLQAQNIDSGATSGAGLCYAFITGSGTQTFSSSPTRLSFNTILIDNGVGAEIVEGDTILVSTSGVYLIEIDVDFVGDNTNFMPQARLKKNGDVIAYADVEPTSQVFQRRFTGTIRRLMTLEASDFFNVEWIFCPPPSGSYSSTFTEAGTGAILNKISLVKLTRDVCLSVTPNNDAVIQDLLATNPLLFAVPAGTNRVLVVGLAGGTPTGAISGFQVTYNGITVTTPASSQQMLNVQSSGSSLWVIPLGSGSAIPLQPIIVTTTTDSPRDITAASFQNVNQTTPFANPVSTSVVASSSSISVPISSPKNLAVDITTMYDLAFPSGFHDTTVSNTRTGFGYSAPLAAPTRLMNWVYSVNSGSAHCGLQLIASCNGNDNDNADDGEGSDTPANCGFGGFGGGGGEEEEGG